MRNIRFNPAGAEDRLIFQSPDMGNNNPELSRGPETTESTETISETTNVETPQDVREASDQAVIKARMTTDPALEEIRRAEQQIPGGEEEMIVSDPGVIKAKQVLIDTAGLKASPTATVETSTAETVPTSTTERGADSPKKETPENPEKNIDATNPKSVENVLNNRFENKFDGQYQGISLICDDSKQTPGSSEYTIRAYSPANQVTLKRLQGYAEKHGLNPRMENGGLHISINGYDGLNSGFTGPNFEMMQREQMANTANAEPGDKGATDQKTAAEKPSTGTEEEDEPKEETEEEDEPETEEGEPEDAEENKEEPGDRAERINKETQETLDELEGKKREGTEPTEEGEPGLQRTEKIKEQKEDRRDKELIRKELMAELRKDPKKGVEKALDERNKALEKIDNDAATAFESSDKIINLSRDQARNIENQLTIAGDEAARKGSNPDLTRRIGTLTKDLETANQNVSTAMQNRETLQNNVKKQRVNVQREVSLLKEMNEKTEKLASATDQKVHELAQRLLGLGEIELSFEAQRANVAHDKSLGLTVTVSSGLQDRLQTIAGKDAAKEFAKGDNPVPLLRGLNAAVIQAEQRQEQERARKG